MKAFLVRLVREDEGQDLIEYALLAAFIALGCVVAIGLVGTSVAGVWTKLTTMFPK